MLKKNIHLKKRLLMGSLQKQFLNISRDIMHALREMKRVLKTEGIVFFRPAWNCRPWAGEGFKVRPYSDFKFFGKLYKASIPFRNNIIYRSLLTFPKRFFYMLLFLINKNSFKKKLIYSKIKANYEFIGSLIVMLVIT